MMSRSAYLRSFSDNIVTPALAGLLLLASCLVNQPVFVGSFSGWCAYGALAVVALILAACKADPVSLIVAALALATGLSPYALPYSFGLLFFAAAFAIGRNHEGKNGYKIAKLIAGGAALWCGYILIRWISGPLAESLANHAEADAIAGAPVFEWHFPALLMPLGHANYTSGLGVLLTPVFAGLALAAGANRKERLGWAFATLLALAVLVIGGSRAALLAIPVALGTCVLFAPTDRLSARRKLALGSAGLLAVGIAVAAHPHFRNWLKKPEAILYSDKIRGDYVEGCLGMFAEKPMLGWGPGALPANFAPFNPPCGEYVSCYHAHSTPFQWMVELGIPGIALFLAIGVFCLAALWRVTRLNPRPDFPMQGVVLAASGYTIFSFFDYQTNIPLLGVAWGTTLGISSRLFSGGESTRLLRPVSRGAFALSAAWVAVIVVREIPARLEVRRCAENLETNLPVAAQHIERAVAAAPDNAAIHGYAAVVFERYAQTSRSAEAAARADAEWEKASACAPAFPQLKAFRALRLAPSDPVKATALFKECLRDGPKFPVAWRGLVESYLRRGDRESAAEALALSLFVRPENAFDPALMSGGMKLDTGDIARRFERLAKEYAKEYPKDTYAIRSLEETRSQITAWHAVGGSPSAFIRANPGHSSKPAWRRLATAATTPGDPEARETTRRAIRGAVFNKTGIRISREQTEALLLQYKGGASAPFSGIRTVATPESVAHFSTYLGVSDLTDIGFPFTFREDLFATLLLYENGPIRVRADKRFLISRLDRLP